MRALIYTRTSAADLNATVPELLADLRQYAAEIRGWHVTLELADRGPGLTGRREGLAGLIKAVRSRDVDIVVTTSLARLCRSQSHLLDLALLLEEDTTAGRQEVALVALEDGIDTTTPDGRVRWRDAVDLYRRIRHDQHSEAVRLARIRTAAQGIDDTWGRPIAAINPFELASHWHGSPTQRPLSVRELAARMGYAEGTLRKRIQELQAAGKLQSEIRARHLEATGGLRKGGRPTNVQIDPADLIARHQAGASLTALRRHYRTTAARITRLLADQAEPQTTQRPRTATHAKGNR